MDLRTVGEPSLAVEKLSDVTAAGNDLQAFRVTKRQNQLIQELVRSKGGELVRN